MYDRFFVPHCYLDSPLIWKIIGFPKGWDPKNLRSKPGKVVTKPQEKTESQKVEKLHRRVVTESSKKLHPTRTNLSFT